MLMDWENCYNIRQIKDIKPDNDMIESLIKTSKNKFESENKLEISEVTASSKLTLAYDSLRELLEALALKKGYKIYNHQCYTAFLKEIIRNSAKGEDFDSIRKVRNDVNYYGKDITIEEAQAIICEIKKLRKYVFNLLTVK